MDYLVLKWVHVLSSTILFGAGVGSAFHLFAATLRRQVDGIATATRNVVLADWLFTVPSAIFQPASGLWLIHLMGLPLSKNLPMMAAIALLWALEPPRGERPPA